MRVKWNPAFGTAAQVVLLVLASVVVWTPRAQGPIDMRWDAAAYYTLGTSLAQQGDYRYLSEPGEPRSTLYPPGLPLLIAAHQVALDTAHPVQVGRALRATYFVLFSVNIILAFAFLCRHLPSWAAVALALISTMTATAVWVSDRAYSDLPCAVAVNIFLLALGSRHRAGAALAGAMAIVAFALRTMGIALLGAWVVDAIVRRDLRRVLVRATISLACVLAWAGYIQAVERSAEYRAPAYPYQRAPYNLYNVAYTKNFAMRDPIDPSKGTLTLSGWRARLADRVLYIPEGIAATVSNSRFDWELAVGGAKTLPGFRHVPWRTIPLVLYGTGILALAGFVILIARGYIALVSLAALYLAQLCLLPAVFFWPRYLSSIGTIVALALGTSLVALGGKRSIRWRRIVLAVPLSVILVAQALALTWFLTRGLTPVTHRDWRGHRVDYRLFSYEEEFRAFDAAVDWLGENASSRDLVIASVPHWVYVRTGLRSIMPPFEGEPETALRLIESTGARYVIVDTSGTSFTRRYARPALLTSPDRWSVVFRTHSGLEIHARR